MFSKKIRHESMDLKIFTEIRIPPKLLELDASPLKDILDANGFKIFTEIVLELDASPKNRQMKGTSLRDDQFYLLVWVLLFLLSLFSFSKALNFALACN